MPVPYGDFEIRQGRMLTKPQVESDGTVDFFGPPSGSPEGPLPQVGIKRLLGQFIPDGPKVKPPKQPRFSAPSSAGVNQPASRSVGIMDVGQGNCNMLIDGESPIAYFDTGFPLWFYRNTAPPNISAPVLGAASGPIPQNAAGSLKVFLSHWDWDHWRLAVRWPALQQLRWTVPEQGLGPFAQNFFQGLQALHNVEVVPQGVGPERAGVEGPTYALFKCHPGQNPLAAPAVLNNTGLAAVTCASPANSPEGVVVLTGDANFSSLPQTLQALPLIGITAVHHGSDAHGAAEQLWEPRAGAAGMIAYSYGCSPRQQGPPPYHPYGFPKPTAVQKYQERGWGPPSESSTAQAAEINGNQISHGNVRMGSQAPLNLQYAQWAFAAFPPTHRLP